MGLGESSATKFRAIDHFVRQFPTMQIIKWEYVDAADPDTITVYTDTETFTVQYNPEIQRSMIVGMADQVPETIKEKAAAIQVEEETDEQPKGRFSGCLASVLTVLYTIYILSYFGDIGMDSLGGFLAMQIVMPHLICVALAAVFSLIGFFGKKRWAMLTAGILMAVSAVLMMQYLPMVIVQAILFFISYARMGTK